MTEPLRILHAISSNRFAGVEQFVRRLAIRQAHDGHTVAVLGGASEQMRAPLGEQASAGARRTPPSQCCVACIPTSRQPTSSTPI